MAPKYRGDEEDWLDNEVLRGTRSAENRPKKNPTARSTQIPFSKANATVIEVFPNQCRVKLDLDQKTLLCSYRRAEVVSKAKSKIRERTPVAVGDRVLTSLPSQGGGVIEGICTRRNCLSRPAPGRERRDGKQTIQHILAANIDLLVIVASADQPKFSPGLMDRFLISAQAERIPVLLCITKIDLANEKPWKLYSELGYPLIEVSSVTQTGIFELRQSLLSKTVVFCGQSGVGKTSLLRNLLGSEIGRVQSVNPTTGKGKHTTTGAVLLDGPQGSNWIDTPGVKEFGLTRVTSDQLADYFPELSQLQCEQKACLHVSEAGCRAKQLDRYSSYLNIYHSLREEEDEDTG